MAGGPFMRLAIFGGTFDPIHDAHLAVAREAADRLQLDRVLFVPAAHPPHKAGVTHALTKTASAWRSWHARPTRASSLASRRGHRLQLFHRHHGKVRAGMAPGDELFFIIGADAFADLAPGIAGATWHRRSRSWW